MDDLSLLKACDLKLIDPVTGMEMEEHRDFNVECKDCGTDYTVKQTFDGSEYEPMFPECPACGKENLAG